MLSVYAKWKGAAYLRATLQKVLERLMLTSQDLDLELDPARVATNEELQKNALQLQIVTKVFVDDICASSASIPNAFRKVCNIVSNSQPPGARVASQVTSPTSQSLTTPREDFRGSPAALSGCQVYSSRSVCVSALLLPRHSCPRRGGPCLGAPFEGDAAGIAPHRQGSPEPGKQCALRRQRTLHVSSQPLSNATYLPRDNILARDIDSTRAHRWSWYLRDVRLRILRRPAPLPLRPLGPRPPNTGFKGAKGICTIPWRAFSRPVARSRATP